MVGARSSEEMSRWAGFTDDRPPLVLGVFFWGSAFISAVSVVGVLWRLEEFTWPLAKASLLAGAGALPLICVLWPLLPWRPRPSPPRRAVAVAFLAASLLLLPAGGAVAPLIVSVAVGNALTVFGRRGSIAYVATAALSGVVLGLFHPQRPVLASVIDGVLVLLLGLIIMVVVAAMIESQRRAEETRRLLADLEEAHAELRRYAARTRDLAIAEERARMARDMHDSVGHYLTVINMGLANAERFRTARPEAAWDEVRQVKELTLEALAETRRWVRALRPLRMEGRTGVEALRALARSYGSDVAFTVTGAWPNLDEERVLVCYRVIQEGLTNALRHAKAGHLAVALDGTPERVRVTVTDDGEGAVPETTENGFGLRGLRERLEAIGGTLDVRSEPGAGFTLQAVVPVQATAEGSTPT